MCYVALVLGATTQLRGKRAENAPGGVWFEQLLRRKSARLATVALANKMARIAWAVLTRGETYRKTIVPPDPVLAMTT
jgi:transposase